MLDSREPGAALVTGAAGGIGAAVAEALRRTGRPVAAVDHHPPAGDGEPPSAPAAGPPLRRYRADVTDAEQVERVVTVAERELGPVEVLANVAGVLHTGSVSETSEQDWQRCLDVNATGVFLMSRAVGERMRARGSGCVVTVGSNAAGVPRSGMAAYAASKAAAAQFTRCLGLELAPYGIRCNVVSPGSTDTSMLRSMLTEDADPVAGDPAVFRTGIPLGRVADPADVAAAVVFLASDGARHVTLHDLYVDGGAALRA